MLVDQLVDLGVAVAGIIALRTAQIVFVEHLVGVIEPGLADGKGERVVLAHDCRIPLRRIDRVERAVDVDVLQLIDQDHRRITIGRDVARRHGDGQPFVGPIAEPLHDLLCLGAVFRDVGIISRQRRQHVRRHAPHAVGRRLHRGAHLALTFADDVDESLAVER